MRDRHRTDRLWWLTLVDRLAGRAEVPVGLGAQFRRHFRLYAIGSVMLGVQQLLMAKRDYLVKGAVDAISIEQAEVAARGAFLILVVSVIAMVARLGSRTTIFTAGRTVEYELRKALLHHLHRLGPSFFGTMPTGEIMSRATNDLHQVRLLLGFGVLNVVATVFSLGSALYVMIDISGRLTLAALSTFPILALVTRSFSIAMFARNRENQEAIGAMSDRVLASLAGIRVVRSFAMEDAELRAFEGANQSYLVKSLRLAKLRGAMWPVMGTVSAIGVLVVFWYGGSLLLHDPEFTTGDFVAFWLALMRLTWPMLAVGFIVSIVQRGRAGYERLKAIFDAVPDVAGGSRLAPKTVQGELRVEGLGFAYGDRRVLDDVSFEVPAGTSLAILGRTGSGKSTLAALLSRLLPSDRGTVYLDGRGVSQLPLEGVRAAIGYAQQDAFLFSTTVANNVGYALDDPDAHRDLIERAAQEAQVLDDVQALPDGFDTVVGERGVQLSGGQKQRVALGRALIREPAVLVLDDPLSAVDARTEAAILEAIDRQAELRTVLLITHRIAAARRCDQVMVLERGRVIEQGSHDELIEAGGVYALFAEEQQMEEELAAVSARSIGPNEGREP
ncbi:MAG: ABC transporter ATP-binding protein [Deltaproteobacteria bacterium]|nr:MAG: ABC transporter ATP-binding protein [Deltaproteobacteria bacterium]